MNAPSKLERSRFRTPDARRLELYNIQKNVSALGGYDIFFLHGLQVRDKNGEMNACQALWSTPEDTFGGGETRSHGSTSTGEGSENWIAVHLDNRGQI